MFDVCSVPHRAGLVDLPCSSRHRLARRYYFIERPCVCFRVVLGRMSFVIDDLELESARGLLEDRVGPGLHLAFHAEEFSAIEYSLEKIANKVFAAAISSTDAARRRTARLASNGG